MYEPPVQLFKTHSSTNPRTPKAVYYLLRSSSEPKRWLIIPTRYYCLFFEPCNSIFNKTSRGSPVLT